MGCSAPRPGLRHSSERSRYRQRKDGSLQRRGLKKKGEQHEDASLEHPRLTAKRKEVPKDEAPR